MGDQDAVGRGVAQLDLSQQYGYGKQSISDIVHIYPRLKDSKSDMSDFSNHDLNLLARVKCDAFRYALAMARIARDARRLRAVVARAIMIRAIMPRLLTPARIEQERDVAQSAHHNIHRGQG